MPLKYMHTRAASTLRGMLKATTRVGSRSLRKRASTMMARMPPTIMLSCTLLTMMLM